MKCYNHHDRDAFAVCTSCGKGLCLECASDKNGRMICKDNQKCAEKCNFVKGLLILILLIGIISFLLTILD